MSKALEKRLARVEQLVAKRMETPRICNCKVATKFHNATCLNAILERAPRVCPLHDFRELGFFMSTPQQYPLISEDNEVCPCPPHPWRSFVLNEDRTWEGRDAAMEAWHNLPAPEPSDFEENKRQTDAVLATYYASRQQWLDTTGRQLPSGEEIRKLALKRAKRAREHGE